MSVVGALAQARSAVATARAHPQSRRKAMLAALLVDAMVDALFEESGGDDVLAFRAALRARAPALAPILDIAGMNGPELVLEPVELDAADATLDVGDVMVSFYNRGTVPRVLIVAPDGSRRDVHAALAVALEALKAETGA